MNLKLSQRSLECHHRLAIEEKQVFLASNQIRGRSEELENVGPNLRDSQATFLLKASVRSYTYS